MGDEVILATGGGLGSSQFFVRLDDAGILIVERREMLKDPQTTQLQLGRQKAHSLVLLAAASNDFPAGCNVAIHGTSAEMRVVRADVVSDFSCSGASEWPAGQRIKSFIDALNDVLPKEFHVFQFAG